MGSDTYVRTGLAALLEHIFPPDHKLCMLVTAASAIAHGLWLGPCADPGTFTECDLENLGLRPLGEL